MNSSMIFPFLLITLLCADTFIFGFSYGLDRVKIPLSSLSLISCISGLTLGEWGRLQILSLTPLAVHELLCLFTAAGQKQVRAEEVH